MGVNEIQVGRYNGLLHKLLDMKEAAPAPTLAPDIFAVLALEADRPEWAFLAGIKLCSASVNIAANAGFPSIMQLSNPPGSGIIVIVSKGNAWRNSDGVILVDISSTSTGLPVSVNHFVRDPRWGAPGGVSPTAVVTSSNAIAAFGPTIERVHQELQASSSHLTFPPLMLTPNSSVQIATADNNTGLVASLHWEERHLEPSETR